MPQQTITSQVHSSPSLSTGDFSLMPILGAAILGLAMLYGVGFASMDAAHNAAHDARHAFAFPCH
jgi:cobalt transporter subunit CbtB